MCSSVLPNAVQLFCSVLDAKHNLNCNNPSDMDKKVDLGGHFTLKIVGVTNGIRTDPCTMILSWIQIYWVSLLLWALRVLYLPLASISFCNKGNNIFFTETVSLSFGLVAKSASILPHGCCFCVGYTVFVFKKKRKSCIYEPDSWICKNGCNTFRDCTE